MTLRTTPFATLTRVLGMIVIHGWLAAATTAAADQGWVAKAFPVTQHDFGSVAVGSKTQFRFPVTNPFRDTMRIQSVRTSCGCTTPTIETRSIAPGEQGSVLATFNTPTFRGKKGATLTVIIDRPVFAEVRLRVDGYIRSDIVMHPGEIDFGSLAVGRKKTESARLMYAGRPDWKILDIKSPVAWLVPRFTENKRVGGSVEYTITVDINPDVPNPNLDASATSTANAGSSAEAGSFRQRVILVTNDRNLTRVPLQVAGELVPPLVVSPRNIAVGKITDSVSRRRKLVIRSKRAVRIVDVQCPGWTVEFSAASETAAKMHVLDVRLTPGQASGETRTTLSVLAVDDRGVSLTGTSTLTAEISVSESPEKTHDSARHDAKTDEARESVATVAR